MTRVSLIPASVLQLALGIPECDRPDPLDGHVHTLASSELEFTVFFASQEE